MVSLSLSILLLILMYEIYMIEINNSKWIFVCKCFSIRSLKVINLTVYVHVEYFSAPGDSLLYALLFNVPGGPVLQTSLHQL